jgi:pilus assembly protein CpaB
MTTRLTAPLERMRSMFSRRGWPRAIAVRRIVAVALVLLAAVLALRPGAARGEAGVSVLVAARELAPGTTLTATDLRTARLPAEAAPKAALADPGAAAGRVLTGAAAEGEPITEVRLAGPRNTRLLADGADVAAVPVRLADPGLAELLPPGSRVDVVTAERGEHAVDQPVLASDAVVVTAYRPADRGADRGPLVLLALPRDTAARVAAAALHGIVTVTLR